MARWTVLGIMAVCTACAGAPSGWADRSRADASDDPGDAQTAPDTALAFETADGAAAAAPAWCPVGVWKMSPISAETGSGCDFCPSSTWTIGGPGCTLNCNGDAGVAITDDAGALNFSGACSMAVTSNTLDVHCQTWDYYVPCGYTGTRQ